MNMDKMQMPVQGDPMVRIIKARDFVQLLNEGYNIPYSTTVKSIEDVKKALKAASRISATGAVTVFTDRFLTSCDKPDKPNPTLLNYIQKMIEDSDDDNPIEAVITNPPGRIPILTPEEANAKEPLDKVFETIYNNISQTAPANHQFLKEPLNDEMLMEALKTAATAMLNDEHTAHMKWKDSDGYHEKEYGVNHLLVSLFYYVYVNGLNSSSSFFWRQRTQFHEYCSRNMPQGLSICTDRHFRNCISNLVLKSCSFDKYIKMNPKPEVEWEKGKFNMEFWYAVYCEAERYFELILPKTTQE